MQDSSGPSLLNDLPETHQQWLWRGFIELSQRLAKEIPALPPSSPVLISGDWGAGKTTLLRALRRQLKEQRKIPTVWFEAWRYEGQSLLLPALMRALWEQSGKEPPADLRNRLWNAAVAVATGIGPEVAKLLGAPATIGLQALLALKNEADAVAAAAGPQPPPDPTEELRKRFRGLLRDLWGEQPVVIFIDDLDRCSPQGAVALLDALRMLIGQAVAVGGEEEEEEGALGCRFVVALDRSVLAEAVARKFAAISSYDGNRYLEKVFPLTFDLPQPEGTAIHQFVRLFLDKAKGRIAGDTSHLDALSVALSEPMFANPRLMKRCINRFYLVMRFEGEDSAQRRFALEHDRPDPEEEAKQQLILAKWIAACERWPRLRRLLTQHDDEDWRRISAHLADASAAALQDSAVAAMLADRGVKTWLRRELLGGQGHHLSEFRVADQRLRRWGL